jgi:MFS family permease
MGNRFGALWSNPDFLKLWVSETISLFGTQVTLLALPLTAVLALDASAFQMGVLGALQYAPFFLVSLPAGVWVDRLRRRPILVGANLGRALLLGSVPLAAMFGVLSMGLLYAVSFLVGVLTVCFDIAYQSYLPSLVGRERLVEGNSKLEVSNPVAQVAGPAVGGGLVQLLTAPLAVLADAASYLVSASLLGTIRAREEEPARAAERDLRSEIGEGLRVVLGSRLLRPIAGYTGASNLFGAVTGAVFLLYVTDSLGVEPALLGLVFGVGSVGALLGALLPARAARRFGIGPSIVGASVLLGLGGLLVPLASGPLPVAVGLLVAAQLIMGLANTVYNVNQISLRQAITPDRLLGRMNASMRFLVWGTIPVGSLLGGALGEAIGLRATLFVGAFGELLATCWVLFSPVRTLRDQPEIGGTPAAAPAPPAGE